MKGADCVLVIQDTTDLNYSILKCCEGLGPIGKNEKGVDAMGLKLHSSFVVDADAGKLVKKYAGRWLVEQEIAEHVAFFNLNNPSSSIVVKVDFLT